jgi:hypothetical protein
MFGMVYFICCCVVDAVCAAAATAAAAAATILAQVSSGVIHMPQHICSTHH